MGQFPSIFLSEQALIKNASHRVCICLCIDASLSMLNENRIGKVNSGVRKFIKSCQDDLYAQGAADVCIITFGGRKAAIVHNFTGVREIDYQDIIPDGQTPMGEAIELALDEIKKRKALFASHGISSFKPWLIIMSDGVSTDDISHAADRLRAAQRAKKIKVMCIDMSNGTEMSDLKKLTLDGAVSSIGALEIEDFFNLLSREVAGLSNDNPEDYS